MILIIDDEAHIRAAVQEILEMAGHTVHAVGSGAEAVRFLQSDPRGVRLALLDLMMPDMDGAATHQALRALAPDLPIILSSGYQHAAGETGIGNDPSLRYLHKPYDIDALLAAVTDALESAAE